MCPIYEFTTVDLGHFEYIRVFQIQVFDIGPSDLNVTCTDERSEIGSRDICGINITFLDMMTKVPCLGFFGNFKP